jgi:hypothetical protein
VVAPGTWAACSRCQAVSSDDYAIL